MLRNKIPIIQFFVNTASKTLISISNSAQRRKLFQEINIGILYIQSCKTNCNIKPDVDKITSKHKFLF